MLSWRTWGLVAIVAVLLMDAASVGARADAQAAADPQASLVAFIERHARGDGGYAWEAGQDESHLTPTFAAIGSLRLLGRTPQGNAPLIAAVRDLHPYRGPRADTLRHAAELWMLTHQQVQALAWLGADASMFREHVASWQGISSYPAVYEKSGHPILQQEVMALLTRRLLHLPIEPAMRDAVLSDLSARRRSNGSYNNLPASEGGDGHVMNTWWALQALDALNALDALDTSAPVASRDALIAWLRACQRANGGFSWRPLRSTAAGRASSRPARIDLADNTTTDVADDTTIEDVVYTWAAVRALRLLKATPADRAASIRYVRSLQNDDGGFGFRAGEPSDLVATYYALDTLGALDALGTPGSSGSPGSLDGLDARDAVPSRTPAGARDNAVDRAPTDATSVRRTALPSGLRAFTIQLQAPGQGSPEEAVELARTLKIHLWGAKNSTPAWIAAAQAIATERRVPVTFFIANEEYGRFVGLPGLGTYSHIADYAAPAAAAADASDAGRADPGDAWPSFVRTRIQPLRQAGGMMIWQINDNEEFSRVLLDASISGAREGYAALSTFHMRQNFVSMLPWMWRYRHHLPFVALQDAHGPEPWWWTTDLEGYRTIFLATEPTWDGWLAALRHNHIVAVRHDRVSRFQTRMLGGARGVQEEVRRVEAEWRWWGHDDATTQSAVDGVRAGNTGANTGRSAAAVAGAAAATAPATAPAVTPAGTSSRPLASIVVLTPSSSAFEVARPDRGVAIRVRLARENNPQGRPLDPLAELIDVTLDDRPLPMTRHEPKNANQQLTDDYLLAQLDSLAAGTHTVRVRVRDLRTTREQALVRTFSVP